MFANVFVFLGIVFSSIVWPCQTRAGEDLAVALRLASMLQSARAVISINQTLINDESLEDKNLGGTVVVDAATKLFESATGESIDSFSQDSRSGRLLTAQIEAIREIIDEHQSTINKPGIGFKGFVPAVFARLVNSRFKLKVGTEATIKVTAPRELVRNRRALPDAFETKVIQDHLLSPSWSHGRVYSATASDGEIAVFRVLVPEYYDTGCLRCHGEPKGDLDVTGYPKEGRKVGELGGVISIHLFRPAIHQDE